jgi:hypothetical protein
VSYEHAPYQGFGEPDAPDRFCVFHARAVNGTYADWEQEALTSTRSFAGSSSYVTQVSGFGPSTITLDLRFDTRRDYMRFRAHSLTVGTLSLLAEFTSHDGPIRTWGDGRAYEQFRDTLLLKISDVQHRMGGFVLCTAVFQRAYDPRSAS